MADKDLQKGNQVIWWQPAVMTFAKLSGWIAAPIVIALYLGKWLDKKYDSAPRLLMVCIVFAFFISMVGLIKETIREYKKIDRLGKNGQTDKKL
ncbi:MAG: AtpZ/AtpI family protein [Candidatus Falkowbacteria bacterium]